MTLLNLGVQDSVRNYYDTNGTVNAKNLQTHVDNFKSKYPNHPQLVQEVSSMTNPDETLRTIDFSKNNNFVQNAPLSVSNNLTQSVNQNLSQPIMTNNNQINTTESGFNQNYNDQNVYNDYNHGNNLTHSVEDRNFFNSNVHPNVVVAPVPLPLNTGYRTHTTNQVYESGFNS